MTESEWLAGVTPPNFSLLHFLAERAGERRLRLFACACVRVLDVWQEDPACRRALQALEDFADGLRTARELEPVIVRAWKKGWEPVRSAAVGVITGPAAHLAIQLPALLQAAVDRAVRSRYVADKVAGIKGMSWDARIACLRRLQVEMVYEVFGNPFRPIALDPAWTAWNDGCAVRLAQSLYAERRFDELPVLADALEEAGCDAPDLLGHLRGPGRHVPGCWALDAVLGRAGRPVRGELPHAQLQLS
jgi:hypothetical protein